MSIRPPAHAIVRASDDRTLPTQYQGKLGPNYFCRGWNAKRKKYCGSRAGKGTAHVGVGRCRLHGGQAVNGDGRIRHGREATVENDRIRSLIQKHLADPNPLDVGPVLAKAKALMDDFVERYYTILPALLAWYAATEPITEEQRLALLRCLDELEAAYGEAEITERQTEDLAAARAATASLAAERVEKPRQLLDITEAVRHADVISKIIHRVNMHHAQNAISYARLAGFMFNLSRELDSLVSDREQLKRINERILQVRI